MPFIPLGPFPIWVNSPSVHPSFLPFSQGLASFVRVGEGHGVPFVGPLHGGGVDGVPPLRGAPGGGQQRDGGGLWPLVPPLQCDHNAEEPKGPAKKNDWERGKRKVLLRHQGTEEAPGPRGSFWRPLKRDSL